jgi:hypothetical protein
MRDERFGLVRPQNEFDRLQEERERWLRIDARLQQQEKLTAEQKRRAELDRREYEALQRWGLSTTTLQTMADQQALNDAKARRDAQTAAADRQRQTALNAQPPANRAQLDNAYQLRINQINEQYDRERERILGYPPGTPTPAAESSR